MKDRKFIIFDLDGTLSDPGEGIIGSLILALRHFGIEGDPNLLRTFIGPPLKESFEKHFSFSETQVDEAIRLYRQYFEEHGLHKNHVYPGIPELLSDLTKAGKTLAIATTKAAFFAHKTLEYLNIPSTSRKAWCSAIYWTVGALDKAELIAAVLERLGGTPQDKVMVGDRKYDIVGAKVNGLDVIAVTYGYGTQEELEALEPTAMVNSVQALRELLLG